MRRSPPGYVLIVALIMVMAVGFSSMLAVRTAQVQVQRERERHLLWVGGQFREALRRYAGVRPAQGGPTYPERLEDLLEDRRFPGVVRHLRQLYDDPFTGKADWQLVRHGGRIVGLRSQSTREPLKQAGFGDTLAHFARARQHADWIFSPMPILASAVDPAGNLAGPVASVAAGAGAARPPGAPGSPTPEPPPGVGPDGEPVDPIQARVDQCHATALPAMEACKRLKDKEFDLCTLAWRGPYERCLAEAVKP